MLFSESQYLSLNLLFVIQLFPLFRFRFVQWRYKSGTLGWQLFLFHVVFNLVQNLFGDKSRLIQNIFIDLVHRFILLHIFSLPVLSVRRHVSDMVVVTVKYSCLSNYHRRWYLHWKSSWRVGWLLYGGWGASMPRLIIHRRAQPSAAFETFWTHVIRPWSASGSGWGWRGLGHRRMSLLEAVEASGLQGRVISSISRSDCQHVFRSMLEETSLSRATSSIHWNIWRQ